MIIEIIFTILLLTIVLKKNFRNNKLIQIITNFICNFIYYSTQYLIISPIGFLLNILKIITVYIKDDVVHGKQIYKRTSYQSKNDNGDLPDPNPDDTCPDENRLF